jgi:formimidoylglutamate deiminase
VTAVQTFLAELGVVAGALVERPRWDVDANGTIVRAGTADAIAEPTAARTRDFGRALVVPGFVNAHSHAFQRGIRGAVHRRQEGRSDFWSWRTAMYERATALDPDGVYAITRLAYREMLRAGITCVGEFHYVHHQPDGRPYADANELSLQVARAAADVGIRLVLLEVFYERAGAGLAPLPEQRRFCDRDVDTYLARVDALASRGITVGLAPHSVRAVGLPALRAIAAHATRTGMVAHAHVSEQIRENDECHAEHGRSPTQLLADAGLLASRFTAVHAIATDDTDRALLRGHTVCVCPTTEADLGDGLVEAGPLRDAGVALALGSDSNAVIDLVQEARALEMGERLRTRRRICLADDRGALGPSLLAIATKHGALALGHDTLGDLDVGYQFDAAVIDRRHHTIADVPDDALVDALLTGGTAAVVVHVVVAGVERTP